MKKMICTFLLLLPALVAWSQEAPRKPTLPLTVSLFSESVSLPTLKGFFRNPNPGIRIGTEFYYRKRPSSQVFQTANVGYYYHHTLHHGLYLSSELGYRKFIGPVFLDATVGAGYLLLTSRVPVYKPTGNGEFVKASPRLHKGMPTLGLGAGYRFTKAVSLFARYEVFGEMPLKQDVPVLPHKALHIGARVNLGKQRNK